MHYAEGRAILVNFARAVVLSHFNFKSKVSLIRWAPNGTKFAVATDRAVSIWATPPKHKEFSPFRYDTCIPP
jgi:periodic tryptophan protein 2